MVAEPDEDSQDERPIPGLTKGDEWLAGEPFCQNWKAAFGRLAQLLESRRLLLHSDQLQGVGLCRHRYSVGNLVAAELAMVDFGPFDVVAISAARPRPVLQSAYPIANLLKMLAMGSGVGPSQPQR